MLDSLRFEPRIETYPMNDRRVNEFSLRVATVNGTGSQSANNILFKSLFRMGIGVCAKNLFPSNIQGLPTWFQIRVSPQGYQNLRAFDDVAVLMNPETCHEDLAAMRPHTTIFYNSGTMELKKEEIKEGMILYPIPVEELAKQIAEPKLRPLLKNLFYVGALSVLYGIERDILTKVIQDTFASKQSAIDANLHALSVGMQYASEHFKKEDAYEFCRDEKNTGKILIDGNTAAALGSIYAGCSVVAWYPITPSSSLAESAELYLKKLRTTSDGKANYVVIQAEDELSSIGMVIGASWAGARAMTATAGPGISLMSEFIGLGYYAEIPAVIFDVQRVGPSTGLPTRTQQCDVQLCATASHGDTKHILLLPATPGDCFELAQAAFDLAEKFQTPVFVLSDLDLGMNVWVENEIEYQPKALNRGKVLSAEQLESSTFGRYLDVDGDGIPFRTLPGTQHPKAAYFTRGSGHDEFARYTESPEVYSRNMERLLKKWNTAKKHVPKPVIQGDLSSKTGIIAYGTSHFAVVETLDRMKEVPIKYLRLKSYPFSPEVEEFLQSCDKVFVIEQNRDGQMLQLLTVDIPGHQQKFISIKYYGGFPLSADHIETQLRGKV
jgi:2-oxoglutarate/2-oxoacid ferredoxin oxidoreductase subunit alpha